MSCTCTTSASPQGEPLPLVSDDCPVSVTTSLATCCTDSEALPSSPSEGATLPTYLTDAACYDSGVTLLGRVGSKLARLVGTGFIAITNGAASIVASVPLQVRNLWHRWWKSSPTANPILGEPLDFPYMVIASSAGDIYGIKGNGTEDSLKMWDQSLNTFVDMPVSELPKDYKGVLPRAATLELVGYAPIGENDPVDTVRPLTGLSGAGIPVFSVDDTAAQVCDCGDPEVSTATLLATPATGTYTLKCIEGTIQWVEDPA